MTLSVTEADVFKILIEEDQQSRVKIDLKRLVDLMQVSYAAELTAVQKEMLKPCIKNYNSRKKRQFHDKHIKVDWDELLGLGGKEALFCIEPKLDQTKSNKRKSLDELGSRKQLKNRTDDLWKEVQKLARDEEIAESRVLGLLLTRCTDKKGIRDIGKELWASDKSITDPKLSVATALAVYTDCQLGKQTYTNLKRVLKSGGYNILPAWKHLRQDQHDMTPEISNLPQPHVGVYFKLLPALSLTADRILHNLTDVNLTGIETLNLKYKFGFDGSGGHAIFTQKKNEQTNNLILSMFCPLELKTDNGDAVWIQHLPNTPKTQRALMIQTGKENVNSLQSQALFNDDIRAAQENGFILNLNSRQIKVKATCASYMMDRKASDLYLGTGGAYCDLCKFEKDQLYDPLLIQSGILITRTLNTGTACLAQMY